MEMAQIAAEADEAIIGAGGRQVRAQLFTEIFEIAGAIKQAGITGGRHAAKARAEQFAGPFHVELARCGNVRGEDRTPVADQCFEALAHLRRHRIAREGFGRALVFLPLQGLRFDAEIGERILEEEAAGGDPEHHQRAVGVGDDFVRPAGQQIIVHGDVVAAQHGDHTFAAGDDRAQEVVQLLRGCEADSGRGDFEQHRLEFGVRGGGGEGFAEVEERRCAAAAQLLERRAGRVLAETVGEAQSQDRAVGNPRRPHDEREKQDDDRDRHEGEREAGEEPAAIERDHA